MTATAQTMPTELLRQLLGLEPGCDAIRIVRSPTGALVTETVECEKPARWIMTAYGVCGHPVRSALCDEHHDANHATALIAACPCGRPSIARRVDCELL